MIRFDATRVIRDSSPARARARARARGVARSRSALRQVMRFYDFGQALDWCVLVCFRRFSGAKS